MGRRKDQGKRKANNIRGFVIEGLEFLTTCLLDLSISRYCEVYIRSID